MTATEREVVEVNMYSNNNKKNEDEVEDVDEDEDEEIMIKKTKKKSVDSSSSIRFFNKLVRNVQQQEQQPPTVVVVVYKEQKQRLLVQEGKQPVALVPHQTIESTEQEQELERIRIDQSTPLLLEAIHDIGSKNEKKILKTTITSTSTSTTTTTTSSSSSSSSVDTDTSTSNTTSAEKKGEVGIVSYTSLSEYIAGTTLKTREALVLIQWHSNGTLYRVSSRDHHGHKPWLPDGLFYYNNNTVRGNGGGELRQAKPSKHGSVAFILNTDVIYDATYEHIPPIPLFVYTIPTIVSSPMFQVIPNPYDFLGISEKGVLDLQKTVHGNSSSSSSSSNSNGTSTTNEKVDNNNNNNNNNMYNEPISFEQYKQLRNVMVWRGKVRNQKERKHLLEIASDSTTNNYNNNDNNNMNQTWWLDVADTSNKEDNNGLSFESMSLRYRYQIDVGGVSGTAWNGLRWKMCSSGGVVFKIDSSKKDWWHDTLVPWEHYIPVDNNVSNLRTQYEWAEHNIQRTYEIAIAGRSICLQTFQQQTAIDTLLEQLYTIPNLSILDEINNIFEHNISLLVPPT